MLVRIDSLIVDEKGVIVETLRTVRVKVRGGAVTVIVEVEEVLQTATSATEGIFSLAQIDLNVAIASS